MAQADNFAGKRVMQLCGVKEQNCPPGVHTGDPVSLGAGFASDARSVLPE